MFRCLHIWPYKDLILHKAWADFRADSQRTYLGILWWGLDPIINTAIYYLIFGIIMQKKTPNFIPFLLVGLVFWRWFDASSRGSARSIYANVSFVRQVSFPKQVFPLSTIATCTYQFFFSLLVLVAALKLFGIPFSLYWCLVPVLLIVEGLLIMAMSLILGSLVPFIPDLATLIDYTFRIGFFLSGIFYSVSSIHSTRLQAFMRVNPMLVLIEAGRDLIMYERMPNWNAIAVIAVGSLVGIYVGAWLIDHFNSVYAKRIV